MPAAVRRLFADTRVVEILHLFSEQQKPLSRDGVVVEPRWGRSAFASLPLKDTALQSVEPHRLLPGAPALLLIRAKLY